MDIKIDWNNFIKNRVWFGWLWWADFEYDQNGYITGDSLTDGKWRRIRTNLRYVPMQLAWKWRGGHPRG